MRSLALLVLLGGCVTAPELGTAVHDNMLAMTVEPTHVGKEMEGTNGSLGTDAVKRLLSDRVKAPANTGPATPFAATGGGPK
ncbi:hypothetical protein [Glacieibacterium sp.]|uniref:hypothetical protein n=1 Tax=Glacieibacterium sp. TaxID=2860237 RepID=UPI003B0027B3